MDSAFRAVYQSALEDPETFWAQAAEDVHWYRRWDRVLDDSTPPFYRWFPGAQINTCFNALDLHVEQGRGEQAALIYDSPVTQTQRTFTYAQLCDETARFAGVLAELGVTKGDRVIVYMPMVPETVIAMLACARLGAIHSVVFGGFAANELAVRIDDAQPKVVVSASCGVEVSRVVEYKPLLDGAIDLADHKPEFCVMLQRPQEVVELEEGRDVDWYAFQEGVTPAECVPVEGDHPAYILYTSGTTGAPKGVVRPTAGHLVALHWTMKNLYGVEPGEVFWAASDVGWVVGHSYICYAPLLTGNTTIVFEGKPVGTPDAGTFWRVCADHKVASFFSAPTAFRAVKREDPTGALITQYDLSSLRTLFLAGERADPDTIVWLQDHLKVPVIDHWWQTETGWCIAGNPMGMSICRSNWGLPRCRCRATTSKSSTMKATRCQPASWAQSPSSCPCRPARFRAFGTQKSGSAKAISTRSRAIMRPVMRA